MQTQRDHVHAHQFLMGRLTSALVLGEPASAEIPGRRALTGLVVGVLLSVLTAVGIGVFGFIVPGGNTAWQKPGVIIVEEETGTRFVFADGALHPVLNQASALLARGGQAPVELVSSASLADLPKGAPIGIAGAPQVVPRQADLVHGPWLVCVRAPAGRTARAEGTNPWLDFDPGVRAEPLPADRALPVVAPNGKQYLVTTGVKYPVGDPSVMVALGMAGTTTVAAPDTWLSAVPTGPKLAAPAIPGAGSPGPQVGGQTYEVGRLFQLVAANGDVQPFVLRADGLAPAASM